MALYQSFNLNYFLPGSIFQYKFCVKRKKKLMETLATKKVSIVLPPIKKKQSER